MPRVWTEGRAGVAEEPDNNEAGIPKAGGSVALINGNASTKETNHTEKGETHEGRICSSDG